MRTSEQINEIVTAIAKAQAELPMAKKSGFNQHTKKHYPMLSDCWEALQAAFPKHGIAILQTPRLLESGSWTMTTRLAHSSGQWIEGDSPMQPGGVRGANEMQGIGVMVTYARRQGLGITGITPDDDDDAQSYGQQRQQQRPRPQAPPKTAPAYVTEEQITTIRALADERGMSKDEIVQVLRRFGATNSWGSLPLDQVDHVISFLSAEPEPLPTGTSAHPGEIVEDATHAE